MIGLSPTAPSASALDAAYDILKIVGDPAKAEEYLDAIKDRLAELAATDAKLRQLATDLDTREKAVAKREAEANEHHAHGFRLRQEYEAKLTKLKSAME